MRSSPAGSLRPSARRWPETDLKIKWGSTNRKKGGGSLYQFGSLPDAWYLFRLEKLSDLSTCRWSEHYDRYNVGVYRLRVSAPEHVKDLRKNSSYASTLGFGTLREMRKLAQKYVNEGGGPTEWSRENEDEWQRIVNSWGN